MSREHGTLQATSVLLTPLGADLFRRVLQNARDYVAAEATRRCWRSWPPRPWTPSERRCRRPPGCAGTRPATVPGSAPSGCWTQSAPGGPWASVDYEPGKDAYRVQQAGDRRLWDETEAAYFAWLEAGQPDLSRFGLTVRPDGQHVWLDHPRNVIAPPR